MNKPFRGSGPHAIAICEALSIDPKTCVSIELRMHVNEVVTVTITRQVYDHEAERLATVLEKCNLVWPDDDLQDVTSMSDTSVRKAAA